MQSLFRYQRRRPIWLGYDGRSSRVWRLRCTLCVVFLGIVGMFLMGCSPVEVYCSEDARSTESEKKSSFVCVCVVRVANLFAHSE